MWRETSFGLIGIELAHETRGQVWRVLLYRRYDKQLYVMNLELLEFLFRTTPFGFSTIWTVLDNLEQCLFFSNEEALYRRVSSGVKNG